MRIQMIGRLARARRGQTMVLGVLGVMLVAMIMLLTLNVGQSIYERIRIQQVADSAAFSTATQEARSFNFFAYTNRANVGNLVAAVSADSYMNMASVIPQLFFTAAENLDIMAGLEYDRCCCAPFCPCVIHCFHASMDELSSLLNYIQGIILWINVWSVDSSFADFIEAIDEHMETISDAQKDMKDFISGQIVADTIPQKLKNEYSDHARMNIGTIKVKNRDQYEAVFEDNKDVRKFVPSETSSGSRAQMMLYLRLASTIEDFMDDGLYNKFSNTYVIGGTSEIQFHIGSSRIIKETGMPMAELPQMIDGPKGQGPGAWDFGAVHTQAWCDESTLPYMSTLGSGKSDAIHLSAPMPVCMRPNMHKNFKCLDKGECFTLFKAEPEGSKDHGQPKAYSFMEHDLSKMEKGDAGGMGPWEVNEKGKIKLDFGDISRHSPLGEVGMEVQISDNPSERGHGYSMSKALVYYHYPEEDEGWKEHPNFLNPYWKAKLQPFRKPEAQDIVRAAGQPDFAPIVDILAE